MRLIHTEKYENTTVKVYRLSETDEFVCRFGKATGKPGSDAGDYFTNDRQDAIDTAKAMVCPTPFGWDQA